MPEGIKDRAAIIGMGCTRFGERWDADTSDLMIEAAYEAYEDAGIESKDIQAVWFGTVHTFRTGMPVAEALKLHYIPITHVENMCASGTEALRNACYAVAAGIVDVAMALGVEKTKDTGWSGLGTVKMTMTAGTEIEPTPPGMFALLATRYFARYGLSPEEGKRMIGRVSVKSHHNGALNPKAHFQKEVKLETVINAPMVAWPLGLFDCCGVSDGAAAAIIVRGDQAKNFRPDPYYAKSLQACVSMERGFRQDFDYTSIDDANVAGKRAYAEAGITNPREEISMAGVHDCFSITEAVTMEDLMFSERGKVREDIESGFFDLDGGLPVQPDGGLKCFGHPIGATGIRMVYELYKQAQGKAGDRQIKDAALGLTHNLGGDPRGGVVTVSIWGP